MPKFRQRVRADQSASSTRKTATNRRGRKRRVRANCGRGSGRIANGYAVETRHSSPKERALVHLRINELKKAQNRTTKSVAHWRTHKFMANRTRNRDETGLQKVRQHSLDVVKRDNFQRAVERELPICPAPPAAVLGTDMRVKLRNCQ